MDPLVPAVFVLVYAGMILGEIPGLALDRSRIALLGAILASGRLSPAEAWLAIDIPTVALLFGLIVVSAQFRLGGFYTKSCRVSGRRGVARIDCSCRSSWRRALCPALLANDIVCVAMAPMLIEACVRRGLTPVALASTFAGNFLILGSIVVEQAARQDVVIDWRVHARTGVPVALATLAIAGAWLWVRSIMGQVRRSVLHTRRQESVKRNHATVVMIDS